MTISKKRCWRFSLRTLFVAVTAAGIWLGWNGRQVQRRNALIEHLKRQDAVLIEGTSFFDIPPGWRIFGARPIVGIDFQLRYFTEADRQAMEELIPECVYFAGGGGFSPEQVERMKPALREAGFKID